MLISSRTNFMRRSTDAIIISYRSISSLWDFVPIPYIICHWSLSAGTVLFTLQICLLCAGVQMGHTDYVSLSKCIWSQSLVSEQSTICSLAFVCYNGAASLVIQLGFEQACMQMGRHDNHLLSKCHFIAKYFPLKCIKSYLTFLCYGPSFHLRYFHVYEHVHGLRWRYDDKISLKIKIFEW